MSRNLKEHFERIYAFSNFVELRETVVGGQLFDYPPTPQAQDDDDDDDEREEQPNVPGRSLLWKLALLPLPPLASPATPQDTIDHQLEYLRAQRESFAESSKGVPVLGTGLPSQATATKADDLDINNPLSLSSNNPWNTYYTSIPLLHTLQQDIIRTFPSISYFRSSKVQDDLTRIMFLYVSDNEEGKKTGYRQGMHELAACLYWVIDFDAVSSSSECTKEEELCSKEHVASDTLTLLTAILAAPSFSISRWYEHSPPSPTTEAPFKPPIARASEELLYRLRRIDPLLAGKLDRESIEGGIFGIRALRLLFTRDFPLVDALRLWDGLFVVASPLFNLSETGALTSTPRTASSVPDEGTGNDNVSGLRDLAIWVGVVMLVRIRNLLLPADYTALLGHLIRYPGGIAYCSSKTEIPNDEPAPLQEKDPEEASVMYPPHSPPQPTSPLVDTQASLPHSSARFQFNQPSRFRRVHHTAYLLQQSITLYRTTSQQLGPLSGAGLIRGNWEVLGIQPRVSDRQTPVTSSTPASESRLDGRGRGRAHRTGASRTPVKPRQQGPYATVSAASLQDLIMRGVSVASEKIEQARTVSQASGTGATAWGMIDEIRRNLPEIPVLSSPSIPKTLQPDPFDLHRSRGTSGTSQHNLPVLKSTSDIVNRDASQVAQDPTLKIWDTGQIGHSVVPRAQPARGGHSKSESVSSGRPPWEHRTRFEVEKDLTEMKATMDILSKAVGHVLDVLLATPTSTAAVNEEQDSQRREALESLDYIREILANGGRGADSEAIDRERLFGETWIRHDRITREKMEQEQRDAERKEKEKTLSAIPSPPAPLRRAAAPDTLPRTPFNNQGAGRGTAVAHGRNDSPRRSMDSFSRPLPGNRGSPLGPPAAVGVLDSPLTSSARASRLVSAPWEHTPSGFSGSGLSSSEIALPRAVRKVSNPLTGKETTSTPSPEQPIDLRRDPLGVLP